MGLVWKVKVCLHVFPKLVLLCVGESCWIGSKDDNEFRDMLQMVSGPCKDENAEPADGPITPTVSCLQLIRSPTQGRNRVIMFVVDLNNCECAQEVRDLNWFLLND